MRNQSRFNFAAASGKTPARTTIGFRLENEKFAELSRRAKAIGVSPHGLASFGLTFPQTCMQKQYQITMPRASKTHVNH